MANNGEEEDPFCQKFVNEFIVRAKLRQQQLEKEKLDQVRSRKDEEEVSYPPLSPLHEEASTLDDNLEDEENDSIQDDNSPLNYSSDLSLECSGEGVYRAEPIFCQNSPIRSAPSVESVKISKLPDVVPLQERQTEQKAQEAKSQPQPDTSASEKTLKELQLKVDHAEQARNQLRKALESSKYSYGSIPHLEAAKRLQIAIIEHRSLSHLLDKEVVRCKQRLPPESKKSDSLGSIQISDIRLKMTDKMRDDLAEDGISHYFFCVASAITANRLEVKWTETINTDDIRKQDLKDYLSFKEKLFFKDFPSDFCIKVEVFELVSGQHLRKLLSILTPSKKPKITQDSNFRRVGSMNLKLADRTAIYKNLFQFGEEEKSKFIKKECKFVMSVKTEQLPYKSGMLHVRCLDKDNRPDWSRFFVELSSREIRFWKSKQDAHDGKKPNDIIELSDLCSEQVQKLTPDDDLYRQNSFVLYTVQQVVGGEKDNLFQRILKDEPIVKIAKHQLAAQNKEDRDAWCSVLDRSIQCYREWHGVARTFSFEQIKEIFSSSY